MATAQLSVTVLLCIQLCLFYHFNLDRINETDFNWYLFIHVYIILFWGAEIVIFFCNCLYHLFYIAAFACTINIIHYNLDNGYRLPCAILGRLFSAGLVSSRAYPHFSLLKTDIDVLVMVVVVVVRAAEEWQRRRWCGSGRGGGGVAGAAVVFQWLCCGSGWFWCRFIRTSLLLSDNAIYQ